jgi:hypothetical protein
MKDFEKLGLFYLGRPLDPATLAPGTEPLLYDARDLVTHAVIVGMTGSGKTGLGIDLLEEAAIDGVPAVILDPKGDLANLFLTFPDLRPEDFLPWVKEEDAARKGISREELAAAEAKKWREGLATWGQDGDRIRRLRDAAEVALFTPGSDAGRPLSILASFAAPPAAVVEDTDLFRDRVETAATSLLALLGVDADPLKSREHILLASLLDAAWRAGKSYDLPGLIADLQKPPIAKIGVLDVETFFPAQDRFALALRLNNLLAAPGFDVWLRGEPLSFDRLLYGEGGRPRLAVVSIAHLSDSERMFLVSLLLNEAVSWMRSRSGSSSLRALLYMDEVFGYLPPVANPPSKKPMLTLLKQARAFGFGVVLATQNPVDLDYKALSNIGTWFLGRLQTERDKARVLDGLEGASAASGTAFDRATMDRLLSGIKARVFLLHNVHDDAPQLMETRWALSYLAGPLDRSQVRRLSALAPATSGRSEPAPAAQSGGAAAPIASAAARPLLPPEIPQVFLPARGADGSLAYRPALLGIGRVHLESPKHALAQVIETSRLAPLEESGALDWLAAAECDVPESDLEAEPLAGATFGALPGRAQKKESFAKWERDFADALYRTVKVDLLRSARLDTLSKPGENERDFRIRLADVAREARDQERVKIEARYAPKLQQLEERERRALARVEQEKQQATSRQLDTAISVGATVLGALFGRKKLSATTFSRAASSARSASRTMKESRDVGLAEETVEAVRAQRADLEAEVQNALAELAGRFDPAVETLETIPVKPRKADVEVRRVVLAWVPDTPR